MQVNPLVDIMLHGVTENQEQKKVRNKAQSFTMVYYIHDKGIALYLPLLVPLIQEN